MARTTNGTTDKIDCGSPSAFNGGLASCTIAGFISRASTGTTCGFGLTEGVAAGNSGGRFSFIWFSDGNLYINTNTGLDGTSASVALAGTGTHHVMAVYNNALSGNANRLKVYVDGVLQTLTFVGTIGASLGLTITPFVVGKDSSDRFCGGTYAEVAGWASTVLTQTDATNLAAGALPSSASAAPTVYVPLWGISSPEPDMSGNGNVGTLTGTTAAAHPTAVVLYPVQVSALATTSSATTLGKSFASTPAVNNAVIVRAWGKSSGTVTAPGVTDNQTPANAYTQAVFNQDVSNGEWAGAWYARAVTSSGTFTPTFSYTGTAGPINVEVTEVHPALALDQATSATGSSTAPAPGSVTTTNATEYCSAVFANIDNGGAATVTVPSGYVIAQKQTNAATSTVGGSAYRTAGVTFSPNPAWTAGNFAWSATQTTYYAQTALPVAEADSAALSDVVTASTAGTPASFAVPDSVAMSDVPSAFVQTAALLIPGIVDSVTLTDILFSSLPDSVTLSDAVSAVIISLPQVADSVGLSDTSAVNEPAGAVLSFAVSDSVAVSDVPAAAVFSGVFFSTSDVVSLADATGMFMPTLATAVADAVALADVATGSPPPVVVAHPGIQWVLSA